MDAQGQVRPESTSNTRASSIGTAYEFCKERSRGGSDKSATYSKTKQESMCETKRDDDGSSFASAEIPQDESSGEWSKEQ